MIKLKRIIFSTALIIASSSVFANQGLVGKMEAFNVKVDENGEETLVKATEVIPNEMIEYVIKYENKDNIDYNNVGIKGNIPEGTIFVFDSETKTIKAKFSIDNGISWSEKPQKIIAKDGETKKINAPISDYNAIKWDIENFEPKSKVKLNYRVKVLGN